MYRSFSSQELAKQYSPSSCIDDINIYIQQYVKQSKIALDKAIAQDTVSIDLSYGTADNCQADKKLDLFLPSLTVAPKRKLHVYIHGGYWQELSKNESSFAATNFQKQGYHFAVINYALAPKATLSEIVDQNRQALAWLYENADNLGFDRNEIYLSGSSAGGHLAMVMALTNWSNHVDVKDNIVKGVCAVSGIYDLTPIAQTYINEPLQLSQTEIESFSPLLLTIPQAQLKTCDIVFAVGSNETNEFKRQTKTMCAHLEKSNKSSTFAEIAQRNHFNVILDLANESSWLSQQAFGQMA